MVVLLLNALKRSAETMTLAVSPRRKFLASLKSRFQMSDRRTSPTPTTKTCSPKLLFDVSLRGRGYPWRPKRFAAIWKPAGSSYIAFAETCHLAPIQYAVPDAGLYATSWPPLTWP